MRRKTDIVLGKGERAVLRQARRFPEVKQVILFGSRARGDAEPRSDIDIAVSCPSVTPARWNVIEEEVQEAETLLKIDLVRLEEASPPLRQEILKTGRVLYEQDQT